jgi:hypothetical protein
MCARFTLPTVLLTAALIAAGCGDNDETANGPPGAGDAAGETAGPAPSEQQGTAGAPLYEQPGTPGGTPSKRDFIAAADGICHRAEQGIREALATALSDDMKAFAEREVVPRRQRMVAELRGLTPPHGDEDEVAGIIASIQAVTDRIDRDPTVFEQSVRNPAAVGDIYSESRQRATDYGLKVCEAGASAPAL